MPDALGGQKRGLNPLELNSWMVVSHHVGKSMLLPLTISLSPPSTLVLSAWKHLNSSLMYLWEQFLTSIVLLTLNFKYFKFLSCMD